MTAAVSRILARLQYSSAVPLARAAEAASGSASLTIDVTGSDAAVQSLNEDDTFLSPLRGVASQHGKFSRIMRERMRNHLSVMIYDGFPNLAIFDVSYTNIGKFPNGNSGMEQQPLGVRRNSTDGRIELRSATVPTCLPFWMTGHARPAARFKYSLPMPNRFPEDLSPVPQ